MANILYLDKNCLSLQDKVDITIVWTDLRI